MNEKTDTFCIQFYLRPDEVGQERAKVTQPRLAELNQYVPVHVLEDELTEETLKQYKVVVVTELNFSKQLEVSEICRANNIHFISTEVRGLFG